MLLGRREHIDNAVDGADAVSSVERTDDEMACFSGPQRRDIVSRSRISPNTSESSFPLMTSKVSFYIWQYFAGYFVRKMDPVRFEIMRFKIR